MKNKETLEEIFNQIDDKLIRYSTEESEFWTHYKIGVMDGLNWKQKESYSREEVMEITKYFYNRALKSVGFTEVIFGDWFNKAFEQFKKTE